MDLENLNSLPSAEAEAELIKCCGCREWAKQVASQRPFTSLDQLIEEGNEVWWSVGEDKWLEAFHSHPRIGEKKAAAASSAEAQKWSEGEQAGVRGSSSETAARLSELNRTYEDKFGHIFIICATGKSSEEMLSNLRHRLENNPDVELRVAAAEQAKITELRIRKLVESE